MKKVIKRPSPPQKQPLLPTVKPTLSPSGPTPSTTPYTPPVVFLDDYYGGDDENDNISIKGEKEDNNGHVLFGRGDSYDPFREMGE